ncbi:MAG: hypothetical protein JST12_14990 [Armatimonadetes bacterium]|nr:hypothetical protein [Armatimonadota bacterium]MBS1702969.1 hypothetical protein [Armatimonadota bacterium]MBS1727411.1 hypothetical protein [Armatimonadota bacterium]
MNPSRLYIASALTIWIAGGLQGGVSTQMAVFGVSPDFLLLAACVLGLLADMRTALILGFAAGFVEGAVVGADMWQYIATRMLVCWLCSFLIESRFQRNYATAAVVTLGCTLISGVLSMILTFQPNILGALKATIISAVYNGVLALLAYVPLERATGTRSQQL